MDQLNFLEKIISSFEIAICNKAYLLNKNKKPTKEYLGSWNIEINIKNTGISATTDFRLEKVQNFLQKQMIQSKGNYLDCLFLKNINEEDFYCKMLVPDKLQNPIISKSAMIKGINLLNDIQNWASENGVIIDNLHKNSGYNSIYMINIPKNLYFSSPKKIT